jgi:hypothetical protein
MQATKKTVLKAESNDIIFGGEKFKIVDYRNTWNFYQTQRAIPFVKRLFEITMKNVDIDKANSNDTEIRKGAIINKASMIIDIMQIDFIPDLLACILVYDKYEDDSYEEIREKIMSMPMVIYRKYSEKFGEYIIFLLTELMQVTMPITSSVPSMINNL